MLRMDPSMADVRNYHADWVANCSPLAFQPRPDLLPDPGCLVPAKAPLLRKLVNEAFARRFSPEKENLGGGAWKYVGSLGTCRLTVRVDSGSQFGGQLRYEVSVGGPTLALPAFRLSYERLWDANLGWDYLTEENAPRSIDFLAEQVVHLARLAYRVNGQAGP